MITQRARPVANEVVTAPVTVTSHATSNEPCAHESGVGARAAMKMVRGYQHLMAGRPSPCRFTPSCSSYALDALAGHGFLRGSWLALRRVLRCHPWGDHGWDPVPESTRGRHDTDRAASSAPQDDRKVT